MRDDYGWRQIGYHDGVHAGLVLVDPQAGLLEGLARQRSNASVGGTQGMGLYAKGWLEGWRSGARTMARYLEQKPPEPQWAPKPGDRVGVAGVNNGPWRHGVVLGIGPEDDALVMFEGGARETVVWERLEQTRGLVLALDRDGNRVMLGSKVVVLDEDIAPWVGFAVGSEPHGVVVIQHAESQSFHRRQSAAFRVTV